ncbi:hypothetical protein M9H77_14800 [Catharanthus roseus]|uniref:Uncharacterized protein n=1 Tax=Catharanthus roseus TaxID=4058 RepID=A0ACC0BP57_CATRO|nr:hypothetical protein M9H77_14800 [Catharanthus roseus]
MDWYSWLSKTNLDPSLTYEYGLSFTRNELQKEDLVYFNHEFLLSLGINVAKHRLEILKLSRKELEGSGSNSRNPNGLWKLILAFNKTKKLFSKKITKLGFHKNSNQDYDFPQNPTWSGALRRLSSTKEHKNVMKSGPLDRRILQEKMMMTNKCLSISGPLDGALQEKFMAVNWSPVRGGFIDGKWREKSVGIGGRRSPARVYGQQSPLPCHYYGGGNLGGIDDGTHSLWSLMFQDLKPT